MTDDAMEPVTVNPAHDEAAQLLESASENANGAPSSPVPLPSSSSGTEATDKPVDVPAPKRRGGFPKGARRNSDGTIARDGAPAKSQSSRSSRQRAARPAQRVYTGDVAAGVSTSTTEATPLTGDVKNGPVPGASGFPAVDPNLVEYVKPRMKLVVKGVTMILARLSHKPGAVALDEEADLMADAFSHELAAKLPEVAAQAGTAGMAGAVLPYAIRLLELFMPGNDSAPQGPMNAASTSDKASQAARTAADVERPVITLAPIPEPLASSDGPQYGTVPL